MSNYKHKVLLGDDEEGYIRNLRPKLEGAGLEVISTNTPEEAKRALHDFRVDVAVFDVMYASAPGQPAIPSWLEVVKDPAFRSIPKVLITGFPEGHKFVRESQSELLGVVDFVDKATGLEAVLSAITKVIVGIYKVEAGGLEERPRVFVIHGHDELAKYQLTVFLYQLRIAPVLISDLAGEGRTIIEQIEKHRDVRFAIATMTPDDIASPVHAPAQQSARARQNVIFEMGYFMGLLGRDRVCVLKKDGVEVLSDFHGVLYVPMDAVDWKLKLARELAKAGFAIDLTEVF